MKYFVIEGMLNGTGIRNKYECGYIEADSLNLPDSLKVKITSWLK